MKEGGLSKAMWRKCSPIRVLIDAKQLTWAGAFDDSDIDEKYARTVANGNAIPSPRVVAVIANALGVEPGGLWAQHLDWLSFRPTLDEYAIRKSAKGARRLVHPVHRAMKDRDMGVKALADLCGLHQRTVRGCWCLTRGTSVTTLVTIAHQLGLDLGELVEEYTIWSNAFMGTSDRDAMSIAAELEADWHERHAL